MKESQYYFSHDAHARHDPKIIGIMSIHGTVAYAWFFMILEMMREDSSFGLPLTKIQQLVLCKELSIEMETLNRFIKDCVDLELFSVKQTESGEKLVSKNFLKRMKRYKEISRKRSEAGRLGGIASAKHLLNDCSTIKENKRKENKRKKSITGSVFTPPTIEQIQTHITEKNYNVDAEKFHAFYESKGWMIGKSKMKKWEAALVTWNKSTVKVTEQSPDEMFKEIMRKCEGAK